MSGSRPEPPGHPDDALLELLENAPLEILGRILPASNLALLARVEAPGLSHAILKPVAGERPLWDFTDGTLARREVAAYRISRAGRFDLVRPTILRSIAELGESSVQAWVGDPHAGLTPVAEVVPGAIAPPGRLVAFAAEDEEGRPLSVVHDDAADVRRLALLDVVLNQADRKGSHVARDSDGRLWAFDQGLCLHAEPKLRTILWGWAGDPLTEDECRRLQGLLDALAGGLATELAGLLTAEEIDALAERIRGLLQTRRLPSPSGGWPSIPWPPL